LYGTSKQSDSLESKPNLTVEEAVNRMREIIQSDPSPKSVRMWKQSLGAGSNPTILAAMRELGISHPKQPGPTAVIFSSSLEATIGQEDHGAREIDEKLDKENELQRLLREVAQDYIPSPLENSCRKVYSKKRV